MTKRRGMNFSTRGEPRSLPEGATDRICLDDPAEPQSGPGTSAQKAGLALQVTDFIVRTARAGLTAWGIHQLVTSRSKAVSRARPSKDDSVIAQAKWAKTKGQQDRRIVRTCGAAIL